MFVIFRDKSAAAITVLQLGYQCGSLISPLLAQPFLDGQFSGRHVTLGSSDTSPETDNSSLSSIDMNITPYYPARFVYAFWIISVLGVFIVIASLALHVHSRITETRIEHYVQATSKQTFRDSLSLRNCSQKHPHYALALLVLLFFLIACVFSIRRIFAKVIFSYARDGPGFSVAKASLMNSAFFISSAVGGLVFILPMMWFHIKFVIQVGIPNYICFVSTRHPVR